MGLNSWVPHKVSARTGNNRQQQAQVHWLWVLFPGFLQRRAQGQGAAVGKGQLVASLHRFSISSQEQWQLQLVVLGRRVY